MKALHKNEAVSKKYLGSPYYNSGQLTKSGKKKRKIQSRPRSKHRNEDQRALKYIYDILI